MKPYILIGLSAFALVSLDAAAQCDPNTRINQLQTVLPGQTVCATRGSDRWQEEHRTVTGGELFGGELWDYKMGPGHTIDPSTKLGDWSIGGSANRQITYTYDAFVPPTEPPPSYTFEVHETVTEGIYNFCGLSGTQNVLNATIQGTPKCH